MDWYDYYFMNDTILDNYTLDFDVLLPSDTVRYMALVSSIILVFLCIMGILGNTLSIAVFMQYQFRKVSINVLLLGLSIADLLLLILATPVFVPAPLLTYWPMGGQILDTIYVFGSARLFPLAMVFQCISVWLLVAITVERWAAVCRPLLVQHYFSPKRALFIILAITILSFLYNSMRFWEFTVDQYGSLVPLLRSNKLYMLWRVTIAHTITTYFLPLAVLVYLSFLVIRADVKSRKFRSEMSPAYKGSLRTARMLTYVVLMFVICYSLSLILNLWELIEPSDFRTASGECLSDLNNILAVLNSATTWLFYLKFSTRYRQGAKRIPEACFKRTSYHTVPNYSATTSNAGRIRRETDSDSRLVKETMNDNQSYGALSLKTENYKPHFQLQSCSNSDPEIKKPRSSKKSVLFIEVESEIRV